MNLPKPVSSEMVSFASTVSDSVDKVGEEEILDVEIPVTGDDDVVRSVSKVAESVVRSKSGLLLSVKIASVVMIFSVVISIKPIILAVVSLSLGIELDSTVVDKLAPAVETTDELVVVMVSVSSKEVASGIFVDVASSSIEESVSEVDVFE